LKDFTMSTQLARAESRQVARLLSVLEPLIQQDIEDGREAGDNFFKEAGKKLAEARDGSQFGSATPAYWAWVHRSFKDSNGNPLSKGRAKVWMGFAEAVPEDPKKPYTSVDDFRRRHLGQTVFSGSTRNKRLFAGAKETLKEVDVEALRQSAQSQAKERELERALYLQMIDIGFKVLAVKLHSDKGGSDEAMIRLNRVRARAKSHA
jgi:hypothetical protein